MSVVDLVNALAAVDGIPPHKAGLGAYGTRLARLAKEQGWCAEHDPCRHGTEAVERHGVQLRALIDGMGPGAF